jgi:hypothetical protein
MSFFKKENKEDKERKKLERKLNNKDSTISTNLSSNNSKNDNGFSLASSSILSSSTTSFSSLSNLNNTKQATTSNSQNDDLISLSLSLNTHEDKMQNSSNNNYSDNLLTLPPPLPSNGPPPVAPKPKKGILKTMSKFAIGHTMPTLSSPSTSSTSSTNEISSSKTSIPPPLQITASSIETSIPNYSKRNSQFVNDLPNFNTNSIATPTTTTTIAQNVKVERLNTFSLPSVKMLPVYVFNIDELTHDDHFLIRTIQINDQTLLGTIYLEKFDLTISGTIASYFLIDNLKKENYFKIFLPGDQLISINGTYVFEKSLNEVKNMLNLVNSSEIVIQVRTNLSNCELIVRNTSNGLIRMNASHGIFDSEIKSLKRAGSIRRKFEYMGSSLNESMSSLASSSNASSSSTSPIARSTSVSNVEPTTKVSTPPDQFGFNSVWLIHQNGYSQAKIFAKIIHKNELNGDVSQVKFKIRLDNGSLIEVNEENLEKANPPQYDYCEDLSQLRFINETSLLHVIRQRYMTLKLIYTYIGSKIYKFFVSINSCIIFMQFYLFFYSRCRTANFQYKYQNSIERSFLLEVLLLQTCHEKSHGKLPIWP